MPYQGQQIVNPRTGQRMSFAEIAADRLVIDSVSPPSPVHEPLHVHPKQESGAEVVSGSLVFEVDGRRQRVAAGERIVIPAGARHRFWNDGEEDARAMQFFRPALETAAFFETLFALGARDELDARGVPRPLQLAVMVGAFSDEIRLVSPPWPLVRGAAALLAPLARCRGYRARLTAGTPA